MSTGSRRHDAFGTVEFSIEVDGERVPCWISNEVLKQRFGATGDTAVVTLMTHMDEIAPVAERVARNTPQGERIIVRTNDF